MERNKFNKLKREEMQTTKVRHDHLELRVKSMFIIRRKKQKREREREVQRIQDRK